MMTLSMDHLPPSRLGILASRYARAGDLPAGEAFHHAFFVRCHNKGALPDEEDREGDKKKIAETARR